MAERLDEDEKEALASLESTPPHRKAHSYSQQLRSNTGGHYKRFHQFRKHSLDDRQFTHPRIAAAAEDFFPYAAAGGVDSHLTPRLDLNLCPDDFRPPPPQPLQEVVASGGDVGIFRGPVRAAVHPGRPACLELRPHPLKETQVGKFLRTIACTESQLWAGQESGVRVWSMADAHKPGLGIGGRARRGDEDAAPFYESGSTSPTLCMMVDSGSRLVWSGHKDGKIRSWKMDQPLDETTPFREGLSWSAHRSPVLSMVMTSHGKSFL